MKKNLPIIVAILLPIIVVVGVLLTLYLPSRSINPEYNILYVVNNDRSNGYYSNEFRYLISGGKLVKEDIPQVNNNNVNKNIDITTRIKPDVEQPRLYVFDVKTEETKEVSYNEALMLDIIKVGNISPEGYSVSYTRDYNNSVIFELFGGYSGDYGWRFTDGKVSIFKESTLSRSDSRYYYNAEVLGWVK